MARPRAWIALRRGHRPAAPRRHPLIRSDVRLIPALALARGLDRQVGLCQNTGMKASVKASPVRERILAVAVDLFYRQGYKATGINQVIAESGVAKASFYDHFPSKDDLLVAYAEEVSRQEFAALRQEAMALPTARQRFFGLFHALVPWFKSSGYRGCPFQNLMAEVAHEVPAVRQVVRRHREKTRALIRELAEALIAEEPRLARVNVTQVTDTYLVLFEGAIATAVAYRDLWPVQQAVAAVEGLLQVR